MNLDRAFVLLLASVNAVAGFTPSAPHASTRVAQFVPQQIRPASVLFSEVEEAAEAPATEEAAEPTFDTSIYIGNLSFDAVESDIRGAFAEHGSVQKVQMPLDRETGRSRGFAFVTMSNAEEHAAAIEALNESEVAGRTIYVSESLPKEKVAENKKKYLDRKKKNAGTKIYVGNLNFDTTMEDLQATFEEYGEVKDCFLPTDYDGNPRGFAFLQMDDDPAAKAIEALNGMELDGRTLNVNVSLPKGTRAQPKQIKLYVGNLSWGTEEGALRELFEEYGKVVDCYIPTDRETGQHRGFAFVTMDPDDALRAADETDGYELDGRILRVNEAQPKGSGRSYNYNDGYDGGDAYDEAEDESWGNDAY
jgi:nucleolin